MHKTHIVFIVQAVVIATSAISAQAVSVPASEVPGDCSIYTNQGCSYTWTYSRSDAAAVLTAAGTPSSTTGSVSTCNNCNDAKNTLACQQTVKADFTETFTANISATLSESGPISASLSGSIGSTQSQVDSFQQLCGSGNGGIAPCTNTGYQTTQNITQNSQASVTSTYTCTYTAASGNANNCAASGTTNGGTATSTATGSRGLMTGNCSSVQEPACNTCTCPS